MACSSSENRVDFTCTGTVVGGNLEMLGYDPVCNVALCAENPNGIAVGFYYGSTSFDNPATACQTSTRYTVCNDDGYYACLPADCCYNCCCGHTSVRLQANTLTFSDDAYTPYTDYDYAIAFWEGLDITLDFDVDVNGCVSNWACEAEYIWADINYSQLNVSPYTTYTETVKVVVSVYMNDDGLQWSITFWLTDYSPPVLVYEVRSDGAVGYDCSDLPNSISTSHTASTSEPHGSIDITWS